eukprot:1796279-Prymnesium_polylepis.1
MLGQRTQLPWVLTSGPCGARTRSRPDQERDCGMEESAVWYIKPYFRTPTQATCDGLCTLVCLTRVRTWRVVPTILSRILGHSAAHKIGQAYRISGLPPRPRYRVPTLAA